MKATLGLCLLILLSACASTQSTKVPAPAEAPPVETLVFGFDAADGLRVDLTMATGESAMRCRMYRDGALQVEHPASPARGFEAFTKSGYFRGGGPGNAGLDLNYLHFEHADVSYKLYDEYSAEDDTTRIGVEIDGVEHPALPGSQRGSLSSLRDIDAIPLDRLVED